MAVALAGICVLDVSDCILGQFSGRMLVDHGADVVRVELPAGTPVRRSAPFHPAGVPAAPVNDAAEVVASPYFACRQHVATLDHPDIGAVPHEGLPFRLSETPGGQRRASPCLGQDTLTVMRNILALTDAAIGQLDRDGTISADPD